MVSEELYCCPVCGSSDQHMPESIRCRRLEVSAEIDRIDNETVTTTPAWMMALAIWIARILYAIGFRL